MMRWSRFGHGERAAQAALLVLGVWLLPTVAHAHLVSTRFGELYSGLLHPLITLAHAVPWLGLGLLAGSQQAVVARWAPLAFPLAVGVGAWVGGLLPESTLITYVNLASFVVLGLLVVLAIKLNLWALLAVSTLCGLSHGYANATPGLTGMAGFLYVLGVALAAYGVITLVAGLAFWLRARAGWGGTAVRAAGSWIVAIGLIFGGFSLMTWA